MTCWVLNRGTERRNKATLVTFNKGLAYRPAGLNQMGWSKYFRHHWSTGIFMQGWQRMAWKRENIQWVALQRKSARLLVTDRGATVSSVRTKARTITSLIARHAEVDVVVRCICSNTLGSLVPLSLNRDMTLSSPCFTGRPSHQVSLVVPVERVWQVVEQKTCN